MFKIEKSYKGLYKLSFIILVSIIIHIYLTKLNNHFLKLLLFITLGVLYYHLIMIVHELVHYTFIPNKTLNEFLGHVLSPLVGLNFLEYRKHHFKHHTSKTVEEDPDSYIYYPVLKEKTLSKRIFVFLIGSVSELIIKLKAKSFPKEGSVFIKYSVIITQLILITIFSILINPLHYFIFWLLPLITVSLFLNRLRVLIEHGYDFDNKYNSPQTTVNVKCNFIEKIIFAPHNFNYHQEHHDFPGIPYYQLPKFYKARSNNIRYKKGEQSSYMLMLFKILFNPQ